MDTPLAGRRSAAAEPSRFESQHVVRPRLGRFGALALLTVVFAIAAGLFGPFASSARTAGGGRILLGRTFGRSHQLVIYATADGTRYTVADTRGRVLAEDLREEDLYRAFPDLDPGSLRAGTPDSGERLMMVDPDE